ncbi:hypothetical protein H696_01773 [Fonticula alba]|uniref:GTP-eEF1A C-terminal domain-containing protein n=1 Tax=Fonticula alba TaxID=691883 RepID=A0A058ZFX9_FONAL|nr:hypothetical protein H696_01773 [Fonticula alba]KCV72377.1 hypothetical protein H696_01773 [Fonticula alba]|eukprot:XP_009493955.1 hypothetical protein H696_01773 [Fonticula alba]
MSTTFAFCGDVGVTLTLEKMSQPALVTSGMLATTFPWVTTSASASKQDAVLSLAPRVTRAVRAQIRVLDSSPAIIAGQIAVFFGPGGLQRQAMISRVRNVLRADPSTIPPPDSQTHDGSDSEDDAPDGSRRMTPAHVLRPGDRAVVHIKFDSPLSTDIFTVCQASSRFLLRDHGITLAVGVVTSTWPMAQ